MACTTSGAQVCIELQFDWSWTRVAAATCETFFGRALLRAFCGLNVALLSRSCRTRVTRAHGPTDPASHRDGHANEDALLQGVFFLGRYYRDL